MKKVVLLICVALLLAACSKGGAAKSKTGEAPAPAKAEAPKPKPMPTFKGKFEPRDIASLEEQKGSTFNVRVVDFIVDAEGRLKPTDAGVLYIAQQSIKAMQELGYVYVTDEEPKYFIEAHLLSVNPKHQAKDRLESLMVTEDVFDTMPYAWQREVHVWTPEGKVPDNLPDACVGFILLVVREQAEGKTRPAYVHRAVTTLCDNDFTCPFSACALQLNAALTAILKENF